MRLGKLATALAVISALTAFFAGNALAAAVTEDVKWFTGAAPGVVLAGAPGLNAAQVEKLTFETEVAAKKVILHSTGTECVGCKIENLGGVAVGSGALKFTGVTVEKPEKCATAATLTTKALVLKADWMAAAGVEPNYWLFEPAAGAVAAFMTFELTGAECPLAAPIVPKGTIFFKTANATGVNSAEQKASSSAAINTAAGGTLHVGTEAASLTTTTKFTLATGEEFGTH
jgi:hypothetical protein